MRVEITSGGPEETASLGALLAGMLRAGDLVFLRGELGAGKTTLVRSIAHALGVAGPVTSPTFTVAQRYEGRLPVAHMDAYRLGGPDDEDAELLADALGGGAVAFVEWPDVVADILPPPRLSIEMHHLGGDRRLVLLDADERSTHAELEGVHDHLRARYGDRQSERGPGPR